MALACIVLLFYTIKIFFLQIKRAKHYIHENIKENLNNTFKIIYKIAFYIWFTLFDFNLIYYLAYFAISIVQYFAPVFSALLLVDVFKRY